ncbi:MAG: hypothetical protein HYX33_02700 [Actinobacteria bacterium]|nr:hypothetical protein [Actinomycetota bacterium]
MKWWNTHRTRMGGRARAFLVVALAVAAAAAANFALLGASQDASPAGLTSRVFAVGSSAATKVQTTTSAAPRPSGTARAAPTSTTGGTRSTPRPAASAVTSSTPSGDSGGRIGRDDGRKASGGRDRKDD